MAGMKVTLDAALRARDVSRPSGADEEQADLEWQARRSARRRPSRPRPEEPERREPERREPERHEPKAQLAGQPEVPDDALPLRIVTGAPVAAQHRARRRTRAGEPT
jgi:hypothetical protein